MASRKNVRSVKYDECGVVGWYGGENRYHLGRGMFIIDWHVRVCGLFKVHIHCPTVTTYAITFFAIAGIHYYED